MRMSPRASALRRLMSSAAFAAAAVTVATPAGAQFYSFSGAVGTFPVNLFPINVSQSSQDLSGNTLAVGSSAAGSFSALVGAQLKADGLNVGDGGTGTGSVTVTGASTLVQLGGPANRFQVGNWGTGSMLVSAGAVVDATVNAGGCTVLGASCRSFIGNGAGSTANLTITGAGSEVRTLRSFGIGQTAVFGPPFDAFTFGTPGGTTNATVNVVAAGTLRTGASSIGVGSTNLAALGTEHGNGNVLISGAGSRWIVGFNSIDNREAFVSAGLHANGRATINITNGGLLKIDGTGGPGPFDGINLGIDGGRGDLTVSGVGSSLVSTGINPVIQVGRSGAAGRGSFNVLAGATASTLFMSIGRDGARGDMLIDGAGSLVTGAGVGTTGVAGAAFANIGRDGGRGAATVSNGGRWLITDAGADTRPSNGSPGMIVGRGVGSTGSLTITGPGSTVEIVSTSLGLAPGVPDNFNPFVSVGFDNPGTTSGQLTVSNGGKLLLTGNALSTVADSRTTSLNIGGRFSGSGTGTATVTGAGSEIILSGNDGHIGVGRSAGSSGTLNVLDQGRVASTSLTIGHDANGSVTIDNGTIALSGFRTDATPTVGAGLTVGRGAAGSGALTLSNGARLTIDNNTLAGGMSIGGDSYFSGGSGVVALSGGSAIQSFGSVGGSITVGRNGTGLMSLDGGSSVAVNANRSVFIGRDASGVGTLSLHGGSSVTAGYVGVGSVQAGDSGLGTLIVSNSSVTAGTLEIGSLGYLGGNNGVINGDVINRGVINPGESPGRLIINGSYKNGPGGRLILDIAPGVAPSPLFRGSLKSFGSTDGLIAGFATDQLLLTQDSTFDFTGLQVTFNFLAGANPNAFASAGGFDLDNFLRSIDPGNVESGLSTEFGPGVRWGDVLASADFAAHSDSYVITDFRYSPNSETATFNAVAVAVPEPETWALMLGGLMGLGVLSRRRSARV